MEGSRGASDERGETCPLDNDLDRQSYNLER